MRRLWTVPALVSAVLAAAGPGQAQTSRPRRPVPVMAAPKPKPAVAVPYSLPPPPPARLALTGLPPTGDGAPVCRAQCTRVRLTCDGADGDCATRWLTCVSACSPARSTAALRR